MHGKDLHEHQAIMEKLHSKLAAGPAAAAPSQPAQDEALEGTHGSGEPEGGDTATQDLPPQVHDQLKPHINALAGVLKAHFGSAGGKPKA